MRIYAPTKSKRIAAIMANTFLQEIGKSPSLFEFVVTYADLAIYEPFTLLPMHKTYAFVIPRTEQAYDRIVLSWHDYTSFFCRSRPFQHTEEEQQILNKIKDLSFKSMFEMFGTLSNCFEAEASGVEKGSSEMAKIIEDGSIEEKRESLNAALQIEELERKLIAIAPVEREYVDTYCREIQNPGDLSLHRHIKYIDLADKETAFRVLVDKLECYSLKFKPKKAMLVCSPTRRPHKHAKSLPIKINLGN